MDNQTWPVAARAMLYIKRQSECYQSHTFHLPQWRPSNCLTVFGDCKGKSRLNHTTELRKQALCSFKIPHRKWQIKHPSHSVSSGVRFMYLDEMKPRQQTPFCLGLHDPRIHSYTLHARLGWEIFTTSLFSILKTSNPKVFYNAYIVPVIIRTFYISTSTAKLANLKSFICTFWLHLSPWPHKPHPWISENLKSYMIWDA